MELFREQVAREMAYYENLRVRAGRELLQLTRRNDGIMSQREIENRAESRETLTGPVHLRAVNDSHGPKYYLVSRAGDTRGRYLPKSSRQMAEYLAQRDYLRKVQKMSFDWMNALSKLVKSVPSQSISELYADNPARRGLIKPLVLSDAEYVSQWLAKPYRGKAIDSEARVMVTERGERVRSKSEKIIADKLASLGIPYRYEFPVRLRDSRGKSYTVYPDFTLLDVAHRRQVYFEHFGMMDQEEYREKAFKKLQSYQRCGIWPGVGLLFTMETDAEAVDTKKLESMLRQFFER